MAVREQLILDLTQALSQIDQLERELDGLFQPIVIPVDIETDAALGQLQRDINAVDNDDIDIDVNAQGVENAERSIGRLGDEFDDAEDSAQDYATAVDRADRETDQLGRTGTRAFGGLKASLIGLATAAGGIVALRGLGEFFGDSIQSASDLQESTSKASVVFGEFFDEIQDFASTAPAALGLANSAALEFTGTFGNLFVALGLSQEAAADLAPDIVQLGADLASFNNLDVTDALDKLRAGLVGEAEPLRALGVNLTAATVNAKALELGLAGSTGEVSEAAKVQARYALILEQTTTAQGDFARTADGIANKQRSLNAEFENFRAAVGEALLPAFEQILGAAPGVISFLEAAIPLLADLATGFADAAGDAATFAAGLGLIESDADRTGTGLEKAADAGFQFADFLDKLGLTQAGSVRAIAQDAIGLSDILDDLRQDAASDLPNPFVGLQEAFTELGSTAAGTRLLLLLDELRDAASATEEDYALFLRSLLASPEAFGLTAAQVRTLSEELEGLDVADAFRPPDLTELVNGVSFVERAIADVGDEAEAAGPKIIGFTGAVAALDNLDPNLELDINFDEEIAALEAQFSRLPSAFDAVKEAFKTSEGEIEDDFGAFADNLITALQNQADFIANVDLLRSLGFDDLADQFLDLGVESADLLADGLADPAALARAESALDGYAAGIDRKLRASTIESVDAAVGSLDELILKLNSLEDVSISASVFLSLTGPGARFAGSFGVGSTGTSDLIGGNPVTNPEPRVQVVQEFNGVVPSDAQAARAAQQVNAIVGNAR